MQSIDHLREAGARGHWQAAKQGAHARVHGGMKWRVGKSEGGNHGRRRQCLEQGVVNALAEQSCQRKPHQGVREGHDTENQQIFCLHKRWR